MASEPKASATDLYLVRKHGAYYRPKAMGYTTNRAEAGRFTLDEAVSYSHPNGLCGPRDGITYEPAPRSAFHEALETGRVVMEGRGTGLYDEALDAIKQLSDALNTALASSAVAPNGEVLDWTKVAKMAGQFGVRYRTNRALEQFFAATCGGVVRDYFDQGYVACWAEMFFQTEEKPIFALTDDIIDRGWHISLATGGITA